MIRFKCFQGSAHENYKVILRKVNITENITIYYYIFPRNGSFLRNCCFLVTAINCVFKNTNTLPFANEVQV